MRRCCQFACLVGVLLLFAPGLRAGEVIDGIAATVNGAAILYSDVDEALRYGALVADRSCSMATPAEWAATLQRLIDQELLRQQMTSTYAQPKAAELTGRLQELKCGLDAGEHCAPPEKGIPLPASRSWPQLLAGCGLTEEAVSERLALQLQLTAFIDARLEPGVRIDSASIQNYYQQKLLPGLQQRGIKTEPPLSQVSRQIEEILRQERVDQLLNTWLQNLRQQGRIRIAAELPLPSPGTEPAKKD